MTGTFADAIILDWVPEAGLREQVLVANPAKLYRFSA